MLGSAPVLAFAFSHIREVFRCTRDFDIVCENNRAWVQQARFEEQHQVGEIAAVLMVDEEEVHERRLKAELRL